MQPTNTNIKIGKFELDPYRDPKIQIQKDIRIEGKIYDKAREIFIKNKSIGTKELNKQLNVTYDEALVIMCLLKQEFLSKFK